MIQPMKAGNASIMQRRICGGWAVTANTEPAMKAVPITPTVRAQAAAPELLERSSSFISFLQASKFL